MKKERVDPWLSEIGKDRKWLAAQCGYSYDYVRNSLAPSAPELPSKFSDAIDRVSRDQSGPTPPGYSEIFLDDAQLDRADQASRRISSTSLAQFCSEAIAFRAKEILEGNRDPIQPPLTAIQESDVEEPVVFPFLGMMAAGEPVEGQLNGETMPAFSSLDPSRHAIFEVNGTSGGDAYPDGSRWIVELVPNGQNWTAKKDRPAVFQDSNGCYLKVFQGRNLPLRSVDLNHPDLVPSDGMTVLGYPVAPYQAP